MLDFPNPPLTVGQTFNNWIWDGTKWSSLSGGGTPPRMTVATTPPSSPAVGDLWWDTTGGNLYVWYNDGSSTQWVPASNVTGPPGAQGVPGPTAVSADASNLARLGSDSLLWVPVAPNYLGGLTLANSTPAGSYAVATGAATSDDNTTLMTLSTAFTKNGTAWAVGSGNGALDTGSPSTNTWYHIFLIKRMDTGGVDVLMSLSATAPTMPTNYTKKRRIGSILVNPSGSDYIPFLQIGDYFERLDGASWDVGPLTLTANGWLTFAIFVPPGVRTIAKVTAILWGANAATYCQLQGNDDPSGSGQYQQINTMNYPNSSYWTGELNVVPDLSRQLKIFSNTAAPNFYCRSKGWIDNRGK